MPEILKNREMLSRWHDLEELSPEDKDRIPYMVDGFIRDAKARKAYKVGV